MHELCYTLPRCPAHEHVDDLSQPVVASTSRDLREALVELGNVVGTHVQRLKTKLADKSTIVPISFATLGAAKDLADGPYAISVQVKNSCDDVGIEMGGGRRRMAKTQNTRIKLKARRRAFRTRCLVKRNRTALKLVMPGAAAQQSYGHVVNGSSATQTKAMRFNLKSATHFGGTSACTATVLAWLFGPTADP